MSSRFRHRVARLAFAVSLGCASPPLLAERAGAQAAYRTIVVFGDTQDLVDARAPELFHDEFGKMVDWVVAHKDSENIDLVLHVGDLIQVGGALPAPECDTPTRTSPDVCLDHRLPLPGGGCDETVEGCFDKGSANCASCWDAVSRTNAEWKLFRTKWQRLAAARIPYGIVRGNHDNVGSAVNDLSDTLGFSEYYGPAHFERLEELFAGSDRSLELLETCPSVALPERPTESCGVDVAHAWRFQIGREPILVVGPSFAPKTGQQNWVRGVLDRHARIPAILLSHDQTSFSAGGLALQRIASDYADRIFMAASGHASTDVRLANLRGFDVSMVRFNRQDTAGTSRRHLALVRFYFNPDGADEVEIREIDPLDPILSPRQPLLARRPFSIHRKVDEGRSRREPLP